MSLPGCRNKIKKIVILIAILAVQFSAISPASGADEASGVAVHPAGQNVPQIHGSRIVWQDNRNGNWDIYMYDTLSDREFQITDNLGDQSNPDVYGDMIVWQDNRNGNWDVFYYDLVSGQETQVTTDANDQITPVIHGEKIVWIDYRNRDRNPDIYLYNVENNAETRITSGAHLPANPAVFEDKIVWEDTKNGNKDIYMYSISGGNVFEISIFPGEQRSLAIHGNNIVWQDDRYGNLDIYLYDINTGQEARITSNDADQYSPDVFLNRVIWVDNRNKNEDIYMYDLQTGQERQVVTETGDQSNPSVYGDKIIWEDWGNGNGDIYMADLNTFPSLGRATVIGNKLVLTYSAVLNPGAVPSPASFTVKAGSGEITVLNVKINGSEVVLTLANQITSSDYVTLDYSAGINPIRNSAGIASALHGVAVENLTPDTTVPHWPMNSSLAVSDLGPAGLTLTWPVAADNVGVTKYRIYKNGGLHTVVGNIQSLGISGLTPGMTYTFRLEAGDARDNWSSEGPVAEVTTPDIKPGEIPVIGLSGDSAGSGPLPAVDLSGSMQAVSGSTAAGQSLITVTVDETAGLAALEKEAAGVTALVPANQDSDVITVRLPGSIIKNLADKGSWIEVSTALGAYLLPAAEINLAQLAGQMGVSQAETLIDITVAKATAGQDSQIREFNARNGLKSIGDAVQFRLEGIAGNKKVETNSFGSYIYHVIYLPEPVNGEMAGGIALDSNGEFYPVPIKFTVRDGKNTAVFRNRRNSTYMPVLSQKMFEDIKGHWAGPEIRKLASRLIIKGMTDTAFAPEANITRAQFATLLVRALGLRQEPAGAAGFSDVRPGDWYAGAVGAAVQAGLIKGYEDGSFRPDNNVTREEAAAMAVRALSLAGKSIAPGSEANKTYLTGYRDNNRVSSWAHSVMAAAVKNGIISGHADGTLTPREKSTRAEASVIISRILHTAGLV